MLHHFKKVTEIFRNKKQFKSSFTVKSNSRQNASIKEKKRRKAFLPKDFSFIIKL